MTKQEIIDTLNAVKDILPKGQYDLVYGAARVMHGISEETEDIDVTCNLDMFNSIAEKGYHVQEYNGHDMIPIGDHITVFHDGLKVSDYEVVEIEGFRVMTVISLYNEMLVRGRKKDKQHIDELIRWFAENTVVC